MKNHMGALTNDAKKALVLFYAEYNNRINHGVEKWRARNFKSEFVTSSNIDRTDLQELVKQGFLEKDILGNIELDTSAIIFFESMSRKQFQDWCGRVWEFAQTLPGLLSLFV